MATYLREDDARFLSKVVKVPDKLVNQAKQLSKLLGDNYKDKKGRKRLEKIASGGENYNKKSEKNKISTDDGVYLSASEIKRANHDLKDKTNPHDLTVALNGGLEMKEFYKNAERRMRTANKPPEIVKQVKQLNVKTTKPSATPTKPVTVGNTTIHAESLQRKKNIRTEQENPLIFSRWDELL